MNPKRIDAMYCPLCDCPSDECVQPDDDPYRCELCGERYCEHGEATVGHSGHWITLAERARDEALSNLDTKHLEQSNSTANPPAW